MHLPSVAGLQLRPLSLVVLVDGYYGYALSPDRRWHGNSVVCPVQDLQRNNFYLGWEWCRGAALGEVRFPRAGGSPKIAV
jgi:hypothetical protein